jgi:hypothetical protein
MRDKDGGALLSGEDAMRETLIASSLFLRPSISFARSLWPAPDTATNAEGSSGGRRRMLQTRRIQT